MNYTSVGIGLTRKCTAQCEICCYESSPKCKEKLESSRIEELINETSTISSISNIGFTGGEAFLELDKLKKGIQLSKKNEKTTTVVTNGFWANNPIKTLKIIKELKDIGLSNITISYDEYHINYVKAQNVSNILDACHKVELACTIQFIITTNFKVVNLLQKLGTSLQDTTVHFIPLYPIGGAKCMDEHVFIKNKVGKGMTCRKGGMFLIDFNGDILPCCSPFIYSTELKIGNIKDLNLFNALELIKKNPYLYILRTYGFDFYLDVAKRLCLNTPVNISSSCELCAYFFNKDTIGKIKFDVIKQYIMDTEKNEK